MMPSGESSRPEGGPQSGGAGDSPAPADALTRRGFLAAALAAAAGGAAWVRSRPRRRAIEGAIVGASHRAGHLLRAGGLPSSPKDVRERAVVIAGGGIAGLSAAWKLAKSGFDDF